MPDGDKESPLFAHARRELVWTLGAWAVCGVWVIGVSWWLGQRESAGTNTILGLPRWVFWGVALPWVAANLFTFWFCFRCMADDPLDQVASEQHDSGPEREP